MAMTLAEESVLEDQPLRKGVIDTLLMDSDLLRVIPFDSIAAFSVTYVFPALDVGVATKTELIEGLEGFRGLVKAISVYAVTQTYSGDDAYVDIGLTGTLDAYINGADFGVALAASGALTLDLTAGATGTIPVGADIICTFATPDTSSDGIATYAVTIQYFR